MSKSTRRDFLSTAAKGSAFLSLGFGLPWPFRNEVLASEAPLDRNGRVLVVLQLSGGNDGLNTVIPYRNDLYHRARPVLGRVARDVVRLDDEYGLNPAMVALEPLWEAGRLGVIHGVGYPQMDRSHFRSMEIWHTARPKAAADAEPYGWLGRTLDQQRLGQRAKVPAVHVGGQLPLALAGTTSVPSIPRPADYGPAAVSAGERKEMGTLLKKPRGGTGNATLDFLRKASRSAFLSAEELSRMARDYKPTAPYPTTGLGQGFKACAQILSANLGVRILYLTIGGFDTHAGQQANQPRLLRWVAESIAAFYKDLAGHRRADEVLTMVFSEFGRRVAENASAGTDHGAAGPMLLAGGTVQGGLHGTHPRLDRLQQGDLTYSTDFRRVYATVLEDWLGFASRPILGAPFERLKLL